MKYSQIVRDIIDDGKYGPDDFMCHVFQDYLVAKFDGSWFWAYSESKPFREIVSREFDGVNTDCLCVYLSYTCNYYKAAIKRAPKKGHKAGLPHRLRIQWWHDFCNRLEEQGM